MMRPDPEEFRRRDRGYRIDGYLIALYFALSIIMSILVLAHGFFK